MFQGSGNIRLSNTLSIGTQTYISNTLSIANVGYFDDILEVGNVISIGGDTLIRGNMITSSLFDVGEDFPVAASDTVTIGGVTRISNILSISKQSFITSDLSIGANTFINGDLNITGSLLVNGNVLSVSGSNVSSNTLTLADGSVTEPSLNFISEPNTGIYLTDTPYSEILLGNDIIGYNNRDTSSGHIYIATTLFGSTYNGGTLTKFRCWGENSIGYITPILFEYTGGQYVVRAIFDPLTGLLGHTGMRTLTLSSGYGSASINSDNFCFGWKEGPLSGTNSQSYGKECVITYTNASLSRYAMRRTTNTTNLSTSNVGNSITFGTDLGNKNYEYQIIVELPNSQSLAFTVDGQNISKINDANGVKILDVNGSINSSGFYAPSDRRIKNNITDFPSESSLEMVNMLKPKKYRYINPDLNKSTGYVYGFLSQEVKEVIPEAINRGVNTIPNIMNYATVTNGIIYYENHGFTSETKLTYRNEYSNIIMTDEILIIDENHFRFITNKIEYDNRIFIIGTVVNDYLFLDKQYLMSLAIGAIQQLSKEVDELKTQITSYE